MNTVRLPLPGLFRGPLTDRRRKQAWAFTGWINRRLVGWWCFIGSRRYGSWLIFVRHETGTVVEQRGQK